MYISCVCTCVYVFLYIHVYARILKCAHMCVYINMHIHVCIYTYYPAHTEFMVALKKFVENASVKKL